MNLGCFTPHRNAVNCVFETRLEVKEIRKCYLARKRRFHQFVHTKVSMPDASGNIRG
jgi:hypothetical protein